MLKEPLGSDTTCGAGRVMLADALGSEMLPSDAMLTLGKLPLGSDMLPADGRLMLPLGREMLPGAGRLTLGKAPLGLIC